MEGLVLLLIAIEGWRLLTEVVMAKQVDSIVADVEALKVSVAAALAALASGQLSPADSAALDQAHSDLQSLNTQLSAAVTPPTPGL